MLLSSDQSKGVALAISSSIFIGSSFIVKKKGLRVAGTSGLRAGGKLSRDPHWFPSFRTTLFTARPFQVLEDTPTLLSHYGGLG